MTARTLTRSLSLLGYFGLLLSLTAWIITQANANANFPALSFIVIGIVPLLFPLRGILAGKPYTHYWVGFMMLFYFSHGVGEVYSADTFPLFAWLEILFSTLLFISGLYFIKFNAKK